MISFANGGATKKLRNTRRRRRRRRHLRRHCRRADRIDSSVSSYSEGHVSLHEIVVLSNSNSPWQQSIGNNSDGIMDINNNIVLVCHGTIRVCR